VKNSALLLQGSASISILYKDDSDGAWYSLACIVLITVPIHRFSPKVAILYYYQSWLYQSLCRYSPKCL